MAQDPAFLFYPGDVLRDTAFMTDAQIGLYMKAMLLQDRFKCIPSEKLVLLFSNASETDKNIVMETMTYDGVGSYFIEWMRKSQINRKLFVKSRSDNGSKGGRGNKKGKLEESTSYSTSFSSVKLPENEIENENVIENEVEGVQGEELLPVVRIQDLPQFETEHGSGVVYPGEPNLVEIQHSHQPTKEDCVKYFLSKDGTKELAVDFYLHYKAQGWKTGGNMPLVFWRAKADKWMQAPNLFASDKAKAMNKKDLSQNNDYGKGAIGARPN